MGGDFLHREFDLQSGDAVEVTLNSAANVMLLDPENFSLYQRGQDYGYYGGHAATSPAVLAAPRSGKWHLVVNLGGYPGRVRAGVRVVQTQEAAR